MVEFLKGYLQNLSADILVPSYLRNVLKSEDVNKNKVKIWTQTWIQVAVSDQANSYGFRFYKPKIFLDSRACMKNRITGYNTNSQKEDNYPIVWQCTYNKQCTFPLWTICIVTCLYIYVRSLLYCGSFPSWGRRRLKYFMPQKDGCFLESHDCAGNLILPDTLSVPSCHWKTCEVKFLSRGSCFVQTLSGLFFFKDRSKFFSYLGEKISRSYNQIKIE